jgi:hypothetical protein
MAARANAMRHRGIVQRRNLAEQIAAPRTLTNHRILLEGEAATIHKWEGSVVSFKKSWKRRPAFCLHALLE